MAPAAELVSVAGDTFALEPGLAELLQHWQGLALLYKRMWGVKAEQGFHTLVGVGGMHPTTMTDH